MDESTVHSSHNADEGRLDENFENAETARIEELAEGFMNTSGYMDFAKKGEELRERLKAVLTGESESVFREYDDLLSANDATAQEYFFHRGFVDGIRFGGLR